MIHEKCKSLINKTKDFFFYQMSDIVCKYKSLLDELEKSNHFLQCNQKQMEFSTFGKKTTFFSKCEFALI